MWIPSREFPLCTCFPITSEHSCFSREWEKGKMALLFKQNVTGGQRLISDGNPPTHTATPIFLLFISYQQHDNCFSSLSSKVVFSRRENADIEEILQGDQRASHSWYGWSKEVLQGHQHSAKPFCIPIESRACCFPHPQTSSVTRTSQNPHSFLSSHVFLKEEPNPVLVETGGCYYYLQEKQKILILSKAQRKQWMGRREVETALQHYHSVWPFWAPKVWVSCPLFEGRETERQGQGHCQRRGKGRTHHWQWDPQAALPVQPRVI